MKTLQKREEMKAQILGLQNIIYKDPIDKEMLTNIIEDLRDTCSKE